MIEDQNNATPSHAEPLLIAAPEVSRLLSLPTRSLWRAVSAGRVPRPVKVGRRTLWRRSDLESWVAGRCPETEARP